MARPLYLALTGPRSRLPLWILMAMLPGLLFCAAAWGQPCVTCRTERCPTKADVKTWCGAARDPLAIDRPRNERQAILIGSEPPGAMVHLKDPHGEVLGNTPLKEVPLAFGRYRLWFSLQGYEVAALDITVEPRGPRQFIASLRPLLPLDQNPTPPEPEQLVPPPVPPIVPAVTPPPLTLERVNLVPATAAARPAGKPLYKAWWLWTAIGVTVAAGVAGVAAATYHRPAALPTGAPSFNPFD